MIGKIRFSMLLIMSIVILSCEKDEKTTQADVEDAKWIIETIDNTGTPTSKNMIFLDTANGIHVAYVDKNSTDQCKIKYAYKSANGTWQTEFIDGDGDCADWVTMKLDTFTQKIYIAYVKNGQQVGNGVDENLILAEKSIESSTWVKSVVENQNANSCYPQLAIDNAHGIHISYAQGGAQRIFYAYRPDGGLFETQLVSEDGYGSSAIVVDENSLIHIVYYRTNDELYHASKLLNDTTWQIALIKEVVSSQTAALPMIVNESGNPELMHILDYDEGVMELASCNQQTWSFNAQTLNDDVAYSSLSMFYNKGNRYVSYKNATGLSGDYFNLRLAYSLNNGIWKTQIIEGNSDNRCGAYNSIFVQENGAIHISYTADTEEVLKYAYKAEIE